MGYKTRIECVHEFHRDSDQPKKQKIGHKQSNEFFKHGHRNKQQKAFLRNLLRKHAKYIYVVRYYNTHGHFYKHGKQIWQSRVYCIGIMTDTNEFKYVLLPYKSASITFFSWQKLYNNVLREYILDENTEVLMDKAITDHDVVGSFFNIMQFTGFFRISHINRGDMYKRINYFYKFTKKKKTFGEGSKTIVWDNLIEGNYMQYLPSDINDTLSTYPFNKKWAVRDTCVSMLYMFIKEILMARKKKWEENKKQELENQYNYSDVKDIEEVTNQNKEEIKDIENNETK